MNAQSIILLTKPISKPYKEEIEADTARTNAAHRQLLRQLSRSEQDAERARAEGEGEDPFRRLQASVRDMEARIIAEHAIISSRERTLAALDHLKRLRTEFRSLQASYDSVVLERRAAAAAAPPGGSLQGLDFKSSLETLVTRFGDSKAILDRKIAKLEKGS